MPRKLKDIDVDEISVVTAAANRRKFFIKKGALSMDQLLASLNSFLGADAVKMEELKKVPLSEEQAKEIQAAVDVLVKFKADFPDDVLAAVQQITKSAFLRPAVEEELTVEKIGARLSKATMAELKKLKEIVDRLVTTEEAKGEAETKKYAKVDPAVAARLAKLDLMEKAEEDRIRKAAEEKETSRDAALKKLQEDLDALKKTKGTSLQKKDDGTPETSETLKKKDECFGWPSLSSSKEA